MRVRRGFIPACFPAGSHFSIEAGVGRARQECQTSMDPLIPTQPVSCGPAMSAQPPCGGQVNRLRFPIRSAFRAAAHRRPPACPAAPSWRWRAPPRRRSWGRMRRRRWCWYRPLCCTARPPGRSGRRQLSSGLGWAAGAENHMSGGIFEAVNKILDDVQDFFLLF